MRGLKNVVIRLTIIVTAFVYPVSISAQKTFTEENAFLIYLKLDTVWVEEFAEEYVYRFQKDKFHLIKEDEFEIRSSGKALVRRVDTLSENTIFCINHEAEFSEYNFERHGFECNLMNEESRIQVLDFTFGTRLPTNVSIELSFVNYADIDLFPIHEDEANVLLKERKNYSNGKINRRVRMNLYFTVNSLRKSEYPTRKSSVDLSCKILKVDFFDIGDFVGDPLGTVNLMNDIAFSESEKQMKDENPENNQVLSKIKKLLSDSELSDDLKAVLIKSTVRYYQDKENENHPYEYRPGSIQPSDVIGQAE